MSTNGDLLLLLIQLEFKRFADIDVLDRFTEFRERNHPVIVLVRLDDRSIHQLLQF